MRLVIPAFAVAACVAGVAAQQFYFPTQAADFRRFCQATKNYPRLDNESAPEHLARAARAAGNAIKNHEVMGTLGGIMSMKVADRADLTRSAASQLGIKECPTADVLEWEVVLGNSANRAVEGVRLVLSSETGELFGVGLALAARPLLESRHLAGLRVLTAACNGGRWDCIAVETTEANRVDEVRAALLAVPGGMRLLDVVTIHEGQLVNPADL